MSTATAQELGVQIAARVLEEVRSLHAHTYSWLEEALIDAGEHKVGLEFAILHTFTTSRAFHSQFTSQEKASEIMDHYHVAAFTSLIVDGLIDRDVDCDSLLRQRYEEYYAASGGRSDPWLKLSELFVGHCKSRDTAAMFAHSLYLTHLYVDGVKLARQLKDTF